MYKNNKTDDISGSENKDHTKYYCINCGNSVKNLYREYSATVLKLTECDKCKSVADKYVEYDLVIVVIDLILLRIMAYRHILLNSEFKNFWKLFIALILLETYYYWSLTKEFTLDKYPKQINTTSYFNDDIYLDDLKFYEMSLKTALAFLSFIMVAYSLTLFHSYLRKKQATSLMIIWKAVTLSSCGTFLLLPSLIWETHMHEFHILFVSLYTTLSQLLAHKGIGLVLMPTHSLEPQKIVKNLPELSPTSSEWIWHLEKRRSCMQFRKALESIGYILGPYCQNVYYEHTFHAFINQCVITVTAIPQVMERERLSFKPGHWVWDENLEALVFMSLERERPTVLAVDQMTGRSTSEVFIGDDAFKRTFASKSLERFETYLERKSKPHEADVVLLQDCKDVALYSCDVKVLTVEFIELFHTKAMDRFLRSLIIYFQYYLQIWEKMQVRRVEASRKLRHPLVTKLEDITRDNLSDLRAMVAKDYGALLTGSGDARKFHHMKSGSGVSLSERDRKRYEMMNKMAVTVVWIALKKKKLGLIEKEFNRLVRAPCFNLYEHDEHKANRFIPLPHEERLLVGTSYRNEKKLKHRSACIQELILSLHDYRMLAIGVTDVDDKTKRHEYLEIAYTAPEELIQDLDAAVGVLGIDRKFLDPVLNEALSTTKKRSSYMKAVPEFQIPPFVPYDTTKITDILPKKPYTYQETPATARIRAERCDMWRKYVKHQGVLQPQSKALSALHSYSFASDNSEKSKKSEEIRENETEEESKKEQEIN